MEVDAFLADAVETVNGKIYALGAGWNILTAAGLPVRQPRIGIGILVRVPYTATNEEHLMEVRLEDADGHALPLGDRPGGSAGDKVFTIGTTLNVGRPPKLKPGDEQIAATSISIDGLVFERADRYRFVISIDREDLKVLPLRVLAAGRQGAILE